MANILLTGAGFSRNWGGWLAAEVFEYLLGLDYLHPRIRRMLWDHKERKLGFEDVYTTLLGAASNPADRDIFERFDQAVAGMFHTMRNGFASATIDNSVLRFLLRFEAIFTLNQDTLLEQRYLGLSAEDFRSLSNGWLFGCQTPGLRNARDTEWMPPGFYTPAAPPFAIKERHQPYFKLHGSSNWAATDDGKLILILGGGKDVQIPKHQLLAWYFEEFERRLPNNQVVVIGYSFGDEHINQKLVKAGAKGARFFIIDPAGVDVIDKRKPAAIPQPRSPFMEQMMDYIDGASRRDLLRTLSSDLVERTKLDHFLTAHERRRV